MGSETLAGPAASAATARPRPRSRRSRGLPTELRWQRMMFGLRGLILRTPFHGLGMPQEGTGAVTPAGSDPWPGNAALGEAIIAGSFAFAGQTIRNPSPLWSPIGASPAWLEELHGFGWLRHLRAAGGDAGRRTARELVQRWIDEHRRWSALAWRPDLTGLRLASWLGQHDFYGASADVAFRALLLVHAGRQAQYLYRSLPGGLSGSALFAALKGLIYAGLTLPRGEAWLRRGRALLDRELARQVLPDGGHIERSPSVHLALLRHLIDLRGALKAAGQPLPVGLQAAIDGMAPMLRLYQHGDGGLALFNDSNEEEGWQIDMVLNRADARSRPALEAPDTGFQRLSAGRTLVLVDSGPPPPPGYDGHAHAGTLSFEMSVGRERLIVNCGAHPGDPGWRRVQRNTAAHSTLVVADTNSSTLAEEGVARAPRKVTCDRQGTEGNVWLDLSHDGYQPGFGVVHRRRLWLANTGEELRGEDSLTGREGIAFLLRFHLHPDVQVTLAQSQQAALLKLGSGTIWQLRASGGELALEESAYLGRRGEIRRAQQLVITPAPDGEDAGPVKWALIRGKKDGKRG
ncbi:MAG: heparinase II/III family protein [Dongiaceae bacterium]